MLAIENNLQDRSRVVGTLSGYAGRHAGAAMLVCGCGVSLRDLPAEPGCLSIGVNDVGRHFDPDYLVVVNPPQDIPPDRLRAILDTRARAVFTQYADLQPHHAPRVGITLGRYGGTDVTNPAVLHYTQNSPYVALCLAIQMGATRIGLIGVDFTEGHFFGPTGAHPLSPRLRQIDAEYARLRDAARERGVEIVNLSTVSRLTAFPRVSLASFLQSAAPPCPAAALRIVSYATTPVAGVPAILARCIAAATPHPARCVWATDGYGNGVTFAGDLQWSSHQREAEAALAEADAVIVHNGKVEDRHRTLLAGKPVVTLAHNYLWNVDAGFVARGMPGLVVGQYQATLPEFAGWTAVPNPVPLWEPAYTPGDKGETVTIAYTPSGKHESYPESHRLYWHGKGYDTVIRVLATHGRRHRIEVIAVGARQMSHADALAAKRRAHIVIDECVTGSYHRNSLEGLAAGCVVVNGVGLRPEIAAMLRHCADGADLPFVHATSATLEAVLEDLILRGPAELAAMGQRNRAWMEAHWDFARQWPRFWQPAIDRARMAAAPPPARRQSASAISVVIPHRGADRLPLLRETLRTLHASVPAAELIVAEVATAPLAGEAVRGLGGIHLRLATDGAFERARALNAGSALASHELIVWHDNDLVAGPGFFDRAVAEMRERSLDYLIPYSHIHYLSEADTVGVLCGQRAPAECRPLRTCLGGRDVSGGMGIVHRRFLARFGGFSQEFVGWGGEDNFWWAKASLLGRAGVTLRQDQVLWHLFHAGSGALTHQPPLHSAHYRRNVALLAEARRMRTREHFVARFPTATAECCPFPIAGLRFVSIEGTADHQLARDVAAQFGEMYGASPEVGSAPAGGATVVFGLAAFAADQGGAVLVEPSVSAVPPGVAAVVTDGAAPDSAATPVWRWDTVQASSQARQVAVALVQALSHAGAAAAPPQGNDARGAGPVWLYWEGELPPWIAQCQATIRAHAPGAHCLNALDFDLIWDQDRDIEIARLGPAQRADFVRAFLLQRHGGIWLDSDCLLMRSLDEIHDLLRGHDFVAHRDRQGYYPNGFIAAAPGSTVAAALYREVCARLRSGRPLGWIALGGDALGQVLLSTRARWHELPCERIQPVCWSDPAAFFAIADPETHSRRFDPAALTYMLSNTQIAAYAKANPAASLLDQGTFFGFLLAMALGDAPAPAAVPETHGRRQVFGTYHRAGLLRAEETLSGPGSTLAQTASLRTALPAVFAAFGITSLLDAGCGDCNWMSQLDGAPIHYTGVDIVPDLIERNRRRHGSQRRQFLCLDFAEADLPTADAVLCRDTLVHYSLAGAAAVLRNLQRSGARYLLATTFPGRGPNPDIPLGGWRPLDMQAAPFGFPPPLQVILENCTEMGGRYADKSLGVWPLQDLPLA